MTGAERTVTRTLTYLAAVIAVFVSVLMALPVPTPPSSPCTAGCGSCCAPSAGPETTLIADFENGARGRFISLARFPTATPALIGGLASVTQAPLLGTFSFEIDDVEIR